MDPLRTPSSMSMLPNRNSAVSEDYAKEDSIVIPDWRVQYSIFEYCEA